MHYLDRCSTRLAQSALLAEDGNLWRQVSIDNAEFQFGGQGGRLEKVDWDGNVVWSYELSTNTQCTHHDFALMPNGNVLLTYGTEFRRALPYCRAGIRQTYGPEGIYVDSIIEIEPTQSRPTIVWQWNAMDHLVQNFDSQQANYGDPAAHPELIDYQLRSKSWRRLDAHQFRGLQP